MPKRDTLIAGSAPSLRLYGAWQLVRRMYPLWITVEAVLLTSLARVFMAQLSSAKLGEAAFSGFMAVCAAVLLLKTIQHYKKDGK